jgi:hypothetical protein
MSIAIVASSERYYVRGMPRKTDARARAGYETIKAASGKIGAEVFAACATS